MCILPLKKSPDMEFTFLQSLSLYIVLSKISFERLPLSTTVMWASSHNIRGRKRMASSTGSTSTIFEELRQEHDIQRTLFERLEDTSGDESARRQDFEQLKQELSRHAAAEEKHFYAQLMTVEMTQEKARHSVAEHHEIDEQVEVLETTDFSSPQWLPRLRELKELVTHHLDEEEQEVFQIAGKALTGKQKADFGKTYRNEIERLRKD